MYDFDPDYDYGKQAVMPEVESHARMWGEAAKLYAADAIAVAIGRRWRDGGEALADLRGGRRILRRLCRMIDADPDAIARAIERAIAQGHGAGLHPRPQKPPGRRRKAA